VAEMLYPREIELKLGFVKIRELLRQHCMGDQGKRNVDKIRFSSNKELIVKLCQQTEQFMKMVVSGESIPSLHYPEIQPLLDKLKVEGIFLEPQEMADILKSLKLLLDWTGFLNKQKEDYPELSILTNNIEIDAKLIRKIESCIDDKGQIRENASPELRKIRSEIKRNEVQARKTLDKVLRASRKSEMIPEDSTLTIRNGRLVMPVKAEFKRTVKGFVHDASASGNIIFIEPSDVLEINNEIKELSYAEKREIIKILTELTHYIRKDRENISSGSRLLGILDLIKSKASLSLEFAAIVPELNKEGKVEWIAATNPVLKKALDKQERQVVPLTFHLDRYQRILLISGPNAGGKSVCLQTVGLLQYMLQCGLPVPAMEGSTTTIFKDIFIDIGDEQSIEDDLSTYSSHLKSMHHFLNFTSKGTLFLIDEFGAGTDPQFGGAIAEAMLEQFVQTKGMGVITTHYNNLKKLGDAHPGLVNGRMRFDVKHLEPLYELEIGKPGSSFALEIAGKIGLPKKLIAQAKKKVGTDAVELDRLLNELEEEKKNFEEQSKKYKSQNQTLEKTLENYKKLQSEINEKRKDILNDARIEAKHILKETNQRVENLIREIRENKAEKGVTKELREDLKKYDKKIKVEKSSRNQDRVQVIDGDIEIGNLVRIKGQDSIGEVLELGKKDAQVIFGDLKSKIKINRLEKISNTQAKKKKERKPIKGINLVERRANFNNDLDIRGKRADEALMILNNFLDDAILIGTPNVRIIHGKGDGILRQVLREELRNYKEVKNFHDEHADRGGAGITVVDFK
jgi:DNA mismatch repair protein MutS2